MKRFLICILVSIIILSSSYKVYADSLGAAIFLGNAASSMAAGEAVGAAVAASAVIPYALAALGIAGLGYIAYDSGLISRAWQALKDAGEAVYTFGSDGVEYIGTSIISGKNFLSESMLKVLAEWGLSEGLFDGVIGSGTVVSYPENIDEYGFSSSVIENLQSLNWPLSVVDLSKENGYLTFVNSSSNKVEWEYELNTGTTSVYLILLRVYNSNNLISHAVSRDTFLVDITKNIGSNRNITSNNSYNTGSYVIRYGSQMQDVFTGISDFSSIPVLQDQAASSNNDFIHALDRIILEGDIEAGTISGIPVTDNIPVSAEGVIELPVWDSETISIADEVYYPVSLPAGVDIPVVYPVGDEQEVLDLPAGYIDGKEFEWPDGLVTDPDFPNDAAQDQAQEGSLEVDFEVPSIPSSWMSDFLLNSEYLQRFPFCVPGDMVRIARLYSVSGDRVAPSFTWEYTLAGTTGEVEINLSQFSEVAAIFRTLFFVTFIVGLGWASKEVIKF